MTAKWPDKKIIPKCECYPSYECDCGSNYGDGFNACHDAFMRVINEKDVNMTNEKEIANEASIGELCKQALEHYIEISDKACHFNSVVPKAIKFYAENYSRHPASGLVPIDNLELHVLAYTLWEVNKDGTFKFELPKFINAICQHFGKPTPDQDKKCKHELKDARLIAGRHVCNCGAIDPEPYNATTELPSVEEIHRVIKNFFKEYNITLHIGEFATSGAGKKLSEAILSYLEGRK